jgi:hypothetical protein
VARPVAPKAGLIAGVLAFVGCGLACSLPLLLAGGAAAGLGSFAAGGRGVALGAAVLLATAAGARLWRRSRARAVGCDGATGCGC